jgi:hypothetical protein
VSAGSDLSPGCQATVISFSEAIFAFDFALQ